MAPAATAGDRVTGVVSAFDDAAGWGEIRVQADGTTLFFHCTAIADGTRTIEVGRHVSAVVVAGHRGRFEAADVLPEDAH
jgi:cold shock CspA family protein